MDNVGIVVESLDAAISFFAELGLELEGRAMIEGDWSGRVTGLRDQRVEVAIIFRYDNTEPEPPGVRLHHLLDDSVYVLSTRRERGLATLRDATWTRPQPMSTGMNGICPR